MALAFFHDSCVKWNFTTILRLVFKLQKWAISSTRSNGQVSLRIGIHVGSVELLKDINKRHNFCGDTINYAQRVMDSACPRQVLLSDSAYREYVGSESVEVNTPPFSKRLTGKFVGPIGVYAKHGIQIPVYKLVLSPERKWWSNGDPIGKNIVPIKLTPLPKEIIGSFSERLKNATSVAFIQLTGDRFLKRYFSGEIKFSRNLRRFWVFMPDPKIYGRVPVTKAHASADFIRRCVRDWKKFFKAMRKNHRSADLKLGLFKEPPYFGASFLDWECNGGEIHVSPYVWNVQAPVCPGYDLQWLGNEPSQAYNTYVEGLDYLNLHTPNKAF